MTRWTLILPALATLAAATPVPATGPHEGAAQTPGIFARFDHREHMVPLQKAGLSCEACHEVGGGGDPRLRPDIVTNAMLTPPAGACHYCHNPSDGREPTAPSHCTLCHDTVAPPVSHGAGWVAAHGAEARISTSSCDNCHKSSFCIDCHERKEGIQYKVHDATWLSVHGIAVQADPTSCGTCHLKADCVSCHATADGRAP